MMRRIDGGKRMRAVQTGWSDGAENMSKDTLLETIRDRRQAY